MSHHRPFPALRISRHGLAAQGSFAESMAAYLEPDPASVQRLSALAGRSDVGLVAHFYMDPELQGVLAAAGHRYTQISDSLVMADRAVDMVRAGARRIVVMGVDFMAENVRAVLDEAGYASVPVYRLDSGPIGCSLAEAAESAEYLGWLEAASRVPQSLHVVYINTSLVTKAKAQQLLPTITCTSSNVVRTVLQAFAQIPELTLWFGPDTYMGQNLQLLFETLSELGPTAIASVHPQHDVSSLKRLLERFRFYPRGNCVVHHLFGDAVARRVEEDYRDAQLTAHLEVPGAMFRLALAAQRQGRGITGSTSDILSFVERTVATALAMGRQERLRFVLGTETGMITSLVRQIRTQLQQAPTTELEVEIVFPVADELVAATDQPDLRIVPGPMSGEGCSIEGGCATCPYMKKNHLDALFQVLGQLGDDEGALEGYRPRMLQGSLAGRRLVEWATEPIAHMRAFARDGKLSDALVADVRSRH